jgi:hypothetical protein
MLGIPDFEGPSARNCSTPFTLFPYVSPVNLLWSNASRHSSRFRRELNQPANTRRFGKDPVKQAYRRRPILRA